MVTAAVAAGAMADLATAGIVAFGGSVVMADPPLDIANGLWTSDTETRVWMERQTVLAAPLAVDAVNTGVIWQSGPLNVPGSVPASTNITSYMIRVDPTRTTLTQFSGFIEFDGPILGVIFLNQSLNDSDALLGRPGVLYNVNQSRGLETGTDQDMLTISADRRRIDFVLDTGTWTDDVRIIQTVPTPGSLAVAGVACSLICRRKRRHA